MDVNVHAVHITTCPLPLSIPWLWFPPAADAPKCASQSVVSSVTHTIDHSSIDPSTESANKIAL